MIKIVAFDLDGTLAKTTNLGTAGQKLRRLPEMILSASPPSALESPLLVDKELLYKVDLLISCGIKVFILTRAPKAYASTLLYLLRIPFHECFPSSKEFEDTAAKLHFIRERSQVSPSEMLYVGDQHDDRVAATGVCFFQNIDSIMKEDSSAVSHFQSVISLCDQAMNFHLDSNELSSTAATYRESAKLREEIFREKISSKSEESLVSHRLFGDKSTNQEALLNDWQRDEFSFKPVVNSSYLTVTQYEHDHKKKQELFQFLIREGFGPKSIGAPSDLLSELPTGIELSITAFKYYWEKSTCDIQALWRKIKHWEQNRGSGSEPQLHYLEFVALCMSAGLLKNNQKSVLVPVPSNSFSAHKPAQASVRLTQRISQLTGLPVVEALHRSGDDMNPRVGTGLIVESRVALIDDQLTTGNTILNSIKGLYEIGIRHFDVYCFTYSKRFSEKQY